MPNRTASPQVETSNLFSFMQAIVRNDLAEVKARLEESPSLARESLLEGATRSASTSFFFEEIQHYLYSSDTPLHAAAAGYRNDIAGMLLDRGASVASRNRRGAEPLHYAADGGPGSRNWNPQAQAAMIHLLVRHGAKPDALDRSGVAPLHRAARQRCPAAVEALLKSGASLKLKNKSGSTPLRLAVLTTGRGGSGSPEAKICQKQIIELMLAAGADPHDLSL